MELYLLYTGLSFVGRMNGSLLTYVQIDEVENAARQGKLYEHLPTLPRTIWIGDSYLLITAIRYDDVCAVRMLLHAGAKTTTRFAGDPPMLWATMIKSNRNVDARVEIINCMCAVGTDLQLRWNNKPFVDVVPDYQIRKALLRNGAPSDRFHSNVPMNRRVIITLLGCKRHRRIMPSMDRWVFRMIALEVWAARDEGDQSKMIKTV